MRNKLTQLALAAATAFGLAATAAHAHHSFAAEFDRNRPVTLEGTVKEMRWVNPHSWLHVYVEDEDGSMVEWAVEGGAPSALLRRGWTRDSLPPGTRVIVEGFQAKDGSLRANARDISFPDGTSLSLGQSNIGAPYEETEGQ